MRHVPGHAHIADLGRAVRRQQHCANDDFERVLGADQSVSCLCISSPRACTRLADGRREVKESSQRLTQPADPLAPTIGALDVEVDELHLVQERQAAGDVESYCAAAALPPTAINADLPAVPGMYTIEGVLVKGSP